MKVQKAERCIKMITLEKIEVALRKADIEGVLKGGAPQDEYDAEAAEIAEALAGIRGADLSEDRVLQIVCDIWTKSFGHEFHETEKIKPVFQKLVRDILDE